MSEKCPKCGSPTAEIETDPDHYIPIDAQWECGTQKFKFRRTGCDQYGFVQSKTCEINQLTAKLAAKEKECEKLKSRAFCYTAAEHRDLNQEAIEAASEGGERGFKSPNMNLGAFGRGNYADYESVDS